MKDTNKRVSTSLGKMRNSNSRIVSNEKPIKKMQALAFTNKQVSEPKMATLANQKSAEKTNSALSFNPPSNSQESLNHAKQAREPKLQKAGQQILYMKSATASNFHSKSSNNIKPGQNLKGKPFTQESPYKLNTQSHQKLNTQVRIPSRNGSSKNSQGSMSSIKKQPAASRDDQAINKPQIASEKKNLMNKVVKLQNQRPFYNKNIAAPKIQDESQIMVGTTPISERPQINDDLKVNKEVSALNQSSYSITTRNMPNLGNSDINLNEDMGESIEIVSNKTQNFAVQTHQKISKSKTLLPQRQKNYNISTQNSVGFGERVASVSQNIADNSFNYDHGSPQKISGLPAADNNQTLNSALVNGQDFESMNASVFRKDLHPLQHATSLEEHIKKKQIKQQKFDESFFQYKKNLKFRNPLGTTQLLLVTWSMIWQIFYPIVFILKRYDGQSCQFRGEQLYYNFGVGVFMLQFIIFTFVVDIHAILVRIYLYIVMNRKQPEDRQKTGESLMQAKREKYLSDLLAESKQKYSHDDSNDLELHWRILYFVPNLIISILFAYGVQYQAVVDIIVLAIYAKDRENQNMAIFVICLIFVISQKLVIAVQVFFFFQSILNATSNNQIQSSTSLDKFFIHTNYINLSQVLYARITKTNPSFMRQILGREVIVVAFQLIIKISVVIDPRFIKNCSHNQHYMIWSISFTLICFIRFLVYFNRRMTVKKKSDNANVLIVVDYIQQYVNDNQLCFVINNSNCDFILQSLANYIKLNKVYERSSDTKQLHSISIKFDCSLYHKIYKEETFKILLANAKIINNNSKLQELRIFETVLSNQDFFLIGNIISYVRQIRSIRIEHCLLMKDHLFNKRSPLILSKVRSGLLTDFDKLRMTSDLSFEQEICQYIKMGLYERQIQRLNGGEKLSHLDLSFVLSSNKDYEKFGHHICSYYQKVNLNKRKIYEEFGILLDQFDFISIKFKIQHYQNHHNFSKEEDNQNNLQDDPQNLSIYDRRQQSHMNLLKKLESKMRQSQFDNIDWQYMIKHHQDKRNILYFSQRIPSNILIHRPQTMQFIDIDLLSIPNIFTVQDESMDQSKIISDQVHSDAVKTDTDLLRNNQFSEYRKENFSYSNELEDFICLMIKTVEEAKYVKALKFRIRDHDLLQNSDEQSLQFFSFSKQWATFLLDTLYENSTFQILQSLDIQSDQPNSGQDLQTKPNGERSDFQGNRIPLIKIDNVKVTCLRFTHLNSISITSIIIDDLVPFIHSVVSRNQQIESITLVNVQKQLPLNSFFFDQLATLLAGKKCLNLSDNNAQLQNQECLLRFIKLMSSIQVFNFQRNPLFYTSLFRSEDKIQQFLRDIGEDQMFENDQIAEQKDCQVQLKSLNLSETFLSKDKSNFHCFMQAFHTLFQGKQNTIESIDMSKNDIQTLDLMLLENQSYHLWDKDYSIINTFMQIKQFTKAEKLSINLSHNSLSELDLVLLLKRQKTHSDQGKDLKICLDLSYNNINRSELNWYFTDALSKTESFTGMLMDMFKDIKERGQYISDDRTEKEVDPEMQDVATHLIVPLNIHPIELKFLKAYNIPENTPSSLIGKDQKSNLVKVCQEILMSKVLCIPQVHSLQQYLEMKETQNLISFDKIFSSTWNSPQIRNKEFLDFSSKDKFLKKDKRRLNKLWKQNSEQTFEFELQNIWQLNLSGQILDKKDQDTSQKKSSKRHQQPLSWIIRKCNDLSILICQFVVPSLSMNELIGFITIEEAKYFMKILKCLRDISKETKMRYREFPFFMVFDVSCFQNLKELKLCNSKIRNENIMVQIVRKLRKKEVKLELLDFSGNKLTPFICKQIALLCRAVKTLETVILDDTELPLSGLVYLLMTTIDETDNSKKKRDELNELDRLLLDNNSLNTGQYLKVPKETLSDSLGFLEQQSNELGFMDEQNSYTDFKNTLGKGQRNQSSQIVQKMKFNLNPKQFSQLDSNINSSRTNILDSRVFDLNRVKSGTNANHMLFQGQKEDQLYMSRLSVRNNNIDNEMMRILRNKVFMGCRVKKFDISGNPIKDKGAKYLAEYFNKNPVLEELHVNHAGLTENGALKLVNLLKNCANLRVLSLASNEKMDKIGQACERRGRLNYDLQTIKYI